MTGRSFCIDAGRGEGGPRALRLSTRGGWGLSSAVETALLVMMVVVMISEEAAVAAAAAEASSFRFASRAFARTALAGSSSNSRLPYILTTDSCGAITLISLTLSGFSGCAGPALFSSTASVIPSNLRFRKDELDEVKDAAEASSIVHMPNADSVSSEALVKEKTVSWGTMASRTE